MTPDCRGSRARTMSASPCPTSKRRPASSSTSSAARSPIEIGPFQSDDDWMQRQLGVDPRARDPQAAYVPLQDRSELRGLRVRFDGANPRRRATATWVAIISPSMSKTSNAAVAYLKSQGSRSRATRHDGDRAVEGSDLGLFSFAVGNAARAGQLSRRNGGYERKPGRSLVTQAGLILVDAVGLSGHPEEERMERQDVEFQSEGATVRAWFYKADGAGRARRSCLRAAGATCAKS